jgi:hypothetical protein
MDRNWSFIDNKAGENPDQKQLRVGLQIKLALLSLVQDYRRLQEIAAGLVDLAKPSPKLSQFASDQLEKLKGGNAHRRAGRGYDHVLIWFEVGQFHERKVSRKQPGISRRLSGVRFFG